MRQLWEGPFTSMTRSVEDRERARANTLLDEAKALEASGELGLAIAKRNQADEALAMSFMFGGLGRHVR